MIPARQITLDLTDHHAGERLAETVALLRIAGKVAQLGGWTIQLPSRILTWSDETCAIHDLPAGHQPTLDEGLGYFPPEYRARSSTTSKPARAMARRTTSKCRRSRRRGGASG